MSLVNAGHRTSLEIIPLFNIPLRNSKVPGTHNPLVYHLVYRLCFLYQSARVKPIPDHLPMTCILCIDGGNLQATVSPEGNNVESEWLSRNQLFLQDSLQPEEQVALFSPICHWWEDYPVRGVAPLRYCVPSSQKLETCSRSMSFRPRSSPLCTIRDLLAFL